MRVPEVSPRNRVAWEGRLSGVHGTLPTVGVDDRVSFSRFLSGLSLPEFAHRVPHGFCCVLPALGGQAGSTRRIDPRLVSGVTDDDPVAGLDAGPARGGQPV